MSGNGKISWEVGAGIANEILELVTPFCVEMCVAGSIRRKVSEIGDIEMVAIPAYEDTGQIAMFKGMGEQINLLGKGMDGLAENGTFSKDKDGSIVRWGDRYRKFFYRGVAVDLFMATEANYGLIKMIRTGSVDFSKWMVTKRIKGGGLPNHMRVNEGYLWMDGKIVPVRTEAELFDLCYVNYVSPIKRGLESKSEWGVHG